MSELYSLEKQYICDLQRGSYKAFDALYSMYAYRLYGFILKLTKSDADTKEIVQDVFVKLWLNRENITPDSSLQSFLFTIAKNIAINKFRANINSPVFVDYVDYLNEKSLYGDNITEGIDYDDFKLKLVQAKNHLNNTQKMIFELSKELGYSNAEVAQKLNLSEQTVKNQLTIILKVLKGQLLSNVYLFSVFFL
ncbi:MAG: sigma-70 family RNA polymerase sigma factor [Bacteroidales bacterium]|nr:sigma-70 family RNA polymerase sigma factor [Bacteroidales bacterium]